MACSIAKPGDCLPKIGGSLGEWAEDAKNSLRKLEIKDLNDFFNKIGSDITHFPKDVQKAIDDTNAELKRFNININDFLDNTMDALKDATKSFATPETMAKKAAIGLANAFKSNNNTATIAACSVAIGGGLVAIGTSIQVASAGVPNPYADYLIAYGPAVSTWACTEAYKQ
ncbi:hypothetical protein [Cohnella hashimotonis]|uniref:Uncharacterized protein n=1 Tax=Cohnella hashimotonis TaxID=2826895 RepID=A0ABT6TEL7_9BACL|nr:hypothetical protein [Cohnella hashimotonis]MDI4644409.1 hypothetical protein [Cohnella hashimotonis]